VATKAELVQRLYLNDITNDTEAVGEILRLILDECKTDFTADEMLDIISDEY
jgi:hypothetical protein